jgi:CheY-like chemotaxis protein
MKPPKTLRLLLGQKPPLLQTTTNPRRDLVTMILPEKGYLVLVAANGKPALKLDLQEKDSSKFIIMDLIMLEMGLRESHEQNPRFSSKFGFLVISDYIEDLCEEDEILRLTNGFIAKSFKAKNLSCVSTTSLMRLVIN